MWLYWKMIRWICCGLWIYEKQLSSNKYFSLRSPFRPSRVHGPTRVTSVVAPDCSWLGDWAQRTHHCWQRPPNLVLHFLQAREMFFKVGINYQVLFLIHHKVLFTYEVIANSMIFNPPFPSVINFAKEYIYFLMDRHNAPPIPPNYDVISERSLIQLHFLIRPFIFCFTLLVRLVYT